jgi:RNA polymerase sigma factor (sigma-70 family)
MPTSPTTSVIEHLRRAALLRAGPGLGDAELLGCFVERRDQAALAALVRQHGPMVWGVCRRLLSHHDAEDAFQATFLVLVRKAASIVPRELVGNWLYGVAHQTALMARRTAARRRAREVQVTVMPTIEAMQQHPWSDVQPLLDQELRRLPDNYRAVIVLCDLQGRTRKDVARQLGVPEGTVAGRLARARAMLSKRLTKRGVTLSGGALAAVLAQNVAAAGVPQSVVSSTIQAASLLAAGKAAATGAISVKVAALIDGVMKAMSFTKLKATIAVVLILGLVATVTAILACCTAAGHQDKRPLAENTVKTPQKQEKEGFTAWGKVAGSLQAGLGYPPGEHRAYHAGESVKLVVRVRNVGKEEVKFQYLRQFFIETPPAVTDGEGKPVPQPRYEAGGLVHTPVEVNLAPGKEMELYELNLELGRASESGNNRFYTLHGTGKVNLQYERVLGNTSSGTITLDPILSKLGTGKLELEIKSEPPPAAWGKEVGGLQAGLGYRPGERRAYHYGETVSLVVWVRNVGKEEVKFHYPYPCIENPLTVTDGDGKPISQPQVKSIGQRLPLEVNLAPGKAIVLHELKRQLRPARESGNKNDSTLYGTGKVSVQYERVVLGDTSSGSFEPNPNLSKLATGKLELEINPESALNQAQPAPLEDPKVVEAIEAAGGKVYFFKEKEHRWTKVEFWQGKGDDASLRHLKGLRHLETLNIVGKQFTDAGLAHLKDVKTIRTINWSFEVSDAGLAHMKGWTNLQAVQIWDTPISGTGLEHLKGFPLKDITVMSARAPGFKQFSDAGMAHLKGFPKLETLCVIGNDVTDAGLVHLKGMVHLERLTLGSDRITDKGLAHLKALATGKLQQLALHCDGVTDAGLEHLKDMTNLKSLSLSSTTVTDDGLRKLQGLTKLTGLTLSGTGVTDAGVAHLKVLSGNLSFLDLQRTNITDAGLAHLQGFKKLEHLNLSHTAVTNAGIEELQKTLPTVKIER